MQGAPDPRGPNANLIRRHLYGEPDNGAQGRRDRAWNAYKDELGNAWRGGRTDPRAATQIEREGERWMHGK
jgi:hypothetical protein